MRQRWLYSVLVFLMFLSVALGAFAKKGNSGSGSSRADNTPGHFDYYQFTLSWAPEFCATQGANRSSSECDPKKHYGLVVHGLWPQNDDGSWPSDCQNASPVSNEIVREMLPIMPARGLIQHEWAKHGTCSGLAVQAYFSRVQQLYKQVKVPQQYQQPKHEMDIDVRGVESAFAAGNNAPEGSFKVACRSGELTEIAVCFTKDFKYRACGKGSAKCNGPYVKVLPVP